MLNNNLKAWLKRTQKGVNLMPEGSVLAPSVYIIVENATHILTLWGRVTHICIGNLTIIGSDNGLSPGRRQAIIWTNAAILLIGPIGTNFSEILIKIITFIFKKMSSKLSSGKRRPSCLGLNVLTQWGMNKMVAIFQMTVWNAFSSMQIIVFGFRYYWRFSLRYQSALDEIMA